MGPGDIVPRLVLALVGIAFMLFLSFGLMWMQHRAVEDARDNQAEILLPPSMPVKPVPTASQAPDPEELRRKQLAAALEGWQKKRDSSDAGLEPLVSAAALDPMGVDVALQRVLHDAVPPERCKVTGLRLAKSRPEAAMAFLHAAQRQAKGRADLDSLAAALDEVRLANARAALAGRLPGVEPQHAGRFLDPLRHHQDPRLRADALALLLEIALVASRTAQDKKDYPLADDRMRDAADLVTKLWLARIAFDADPWRQVPAAVREDLEDDNPGATPEQLLQALEGHVRNHRWTPPEAEKLKAGMPRLLASWGVAELERQRESGLDRLRGALRSGDAAAKQIAITGLQAACREALVKQDFAALVDLAGFMIAETSMDAADPFRAELQKGLEASSAHFGGTSPRTRVFVLTLLADLLGEPAGAAARAEALAMGEQLMSGLAARPADPEILRRPSGLPGYAVMRVENGTTFHLMLFFAGPEKFYVRMNPMRRGLLVMKDGAYTTAVMGNTEEVVPYRGAQTFASDVKDARYTVKQEGRGASSWYSAYSASAYGPYTLLRVAAGADRKVASARLTETPPEEPDEARTKAIAALKTGTGTTAGDAVRELARHKASAEAFEALAWALENHPDANIPFLVAEQIVRFRRRFDVSKAFESAIAKAPAEQVPGYIGYAARGRVAGVEKLIAAGLARPDARKGLIRLLAGPEVVLSEAEKLLAPLAVAPDADTRNAALRALAERKSAKGFAAAEALLASPDVAERKNGVFLLNFYRDSPRTEWLLVQLEARETDRRLKGDLLLKLSARGGTAYPALLAGRLRTGTKADKLDALHYLYAWPGKVDPLRPALAAAAADPDPQVRQRAAQKLAELQAR